MPPDPQALARAIREPGAPPAASDEALLRWAGENVKEPWLRICRCWDRMSRGESVGREEALLPIPLTPFTADYRAMFYIMRDLNPLMTFEPGNLFTIILDSSGTHILRAYLERTRMNTYISLDDVDPHGKWADAAGEMIASGRLSMLREHLNAYILKERGENVNWVKIANIRFFGAFRDALEEFRTKGTLKAYSDAAYRTIAKINANNWIQFSPKPKGFARLEELVGKDSQGILRYDPLDFTEGMPDPELRSLLSDKYLLTLRGRDYTVALKFSAQDPFNLFLDQDEAGSYNSAPFHSLPRRMAQGTGARMVLALHADALYSILHEYALRPFPYTKTDTEIILRKLLYMVKEYRSQWAVYPVPVWLKGYARIGRFLGFPYDISYLSYWFLPRLMIEGGMLSLGHLQRFAFMALEGNAVRAAVILEMYEGGIRRVRTFPAQELSPFFRDSPVREALIRAKHYIWEKDGWINFAAAFQTGLLREILKLNLSGKLASLLRLPGTLPNIRRIWGILRQGGVTVYPDRAFVELEKWVKKTGRLRVWLTALQVPFDRQRPRTRGLLYVRETVLALLVLGAFLFVVFRLII